MVQRGVAVVVGLALATAAIAAPKVIRVLVSTGASVSLTGDAGIEPGAEYSIQCSADCRFKTCMDSEGCFAGSDDYLVPKEPAGIGSIIMPSGHWFIAVAPADVLPDGGDNPGTTSSVTARLYHEDPRITPVFR